MHRHRIATLSAALLLASASVAIAQTGSSGGTSSGGSTGGTSGGTTGGMSSGTAGGTTSPGTAGAAPSRLTPTQPQGGQMGPTVRGPSPNPSAVQPPSVTGQPQSNPSAAQPPTVALPSTRPGCNPSQQAGGPTIAGTGSVGTASVSGGGVTARQDNQVDTTMGSGSPQTPTSNPRTPANAEGLATGTPGTTTGARSGGTVDTGTPRIANDPSLGTGRTVQTNPGSVGVSSVSGTPGTPSAQSPGASVGSSSPSAAPNSGSVATGC